jgi:hypothetical protein
VEDARLHVLSTHPILSFFLSFLGRDPKKPTIASQGQLTSKVIVDILDNRIHLSGEICPIQIPCLLDNVLA